jgi:hypothetical protein
MYIDCLAYKLGKWVLTDAGLDPADGVLTQGLHTAHGHYTHNLHSDRSDRCIQYLAGKQGKWETSMTDAGLSACRCVVLAGVHALIVDGTAAKQL